jgi:hypothetical protein
VNAPPQALRFHAACLFAALLCLLALLPLPMHSFYRLVQYAVTGVAAYGLVTVVLTRRYSAIVPLAAVLVLFNPIRPIVMGPAAWHAAEVMAAAILLGLAHWVKPGRLEAECGAECEPSPPGSLSQG